MKLRHMATKELLMLAATPISEDGCGMKIGDATASLARDGVIYGMGATAEAMAMVCEHPAVSWYDTQTVLGVMPDMLFQPFVGVTVLIHPDMPPQEVALHLRRMANMMEVREETAKQLASRLRVRSGGGEAFGEELDDLLTAEALIMETGELPSGKPLPHKTRRPDLGPIHKNIAKKAAKKSKKQAEREEVCDAAAE